MLILAPAADDSIALRLRDELRLLGMTAELRVDAGPDEPGAVGAQRGAAVVARVQGAPERVTLWFAGALGPSAPGGGERAQAGGAAQGGGRSAVDPGGSELVIERPSIDAGAGALALAAVEIIRARLIELPAGAAGSAPAAATEPSGSSRPPSRLLGAKGSAAGAGAGAGPHRGARPAALPERAPGALTLGLAPALGLSPGGVTASLHLRLGARYRLVGPFGIGGWLLAPTTAASIEGAAGAVDLRLLALGVVASVRLTPPGAPVELYGGLGPGLAVLFFDGSASAPYRAQSGSRVVALPHALLALRYPLRRWLALRAGLTAALALPQPVVRIAGDEAAVWGRPLMLPALGLEVTP